MTWLIVLLALAVAFVGTTGAVTRLRSASLKRQFGPEYDRTVEHTGDRRNAEAALRDRLEQRSGIEIAALSTAARARYVKEWFTVQARFVDDPRHTLDEAAELLTRAMNESGYPVDESDDYSTYVSVDHPNLVADYRMAEAVRISAGVATIDDQRQALQNYRSLFDELLNSRAASADDAAEPGAERAEHDVS